MKPPMAPVVWQPPPASGRLKTRARKRLPLRRIALPARGEDVAIDAEGRLIAGLENGLIVRLRSTAEKSVEVLATTGGRPIGIEVQPDQRIVICDAKRGLLRLDPITRRLEVLVDARKQGLGFCNNAAIARDGSIYFSDSSQRFGLEHWRGELLEHSSSGRLLRRAPDGTLHVLLEGLDFANGVALSADESFVAVAETSAYRVRRLWLTGPRAGQNDMLIDRLPAFPDNLATDQAGRIWIALAGTRLALLDLLLPRPPILRRLLWAVPQSLLPGPSRSVRVLAVDDSGAVVREVAGRSPWFHFVTGMRVHGDTLYLASLLEPALAALTL